MAQFASDFRRCLHEGALKIISVALFLFAAAFMVLAAGCTGDSMTPGYVAITGGNPNRGKAVIEHFGCGSCHIIPGIPNANGLVGPPLIKFGLRTFVAGEVPNTPQNLVQWIEVPTSIEPHTAMPVLGVNEQQARDAAAYLYTLR